MREFKASNGWHIDEDGMLRGSYGDRILLRSGTNYARQFFQELRDHELGRWRDPELTQAVCYPSEHGVSVLVFHERYGESRVFYRGDNFGDTAVEQVAKRYFEAHPQHKPLPTAEGFYVNRSMFVPQATTAIILVHFGDAGWGFEYDLGSDATDLAQKWHDAGELVRLVPEGSGDE